MPNDFDPKRPFKNVSVPVAEKELPQGLDMAMQELEKEEVPEPPPAEEAPKDQIESLCAAIAELEHSRGRETSITPQVVHAWKKKFGRVYGAALMEDIFVFHPIAYMVWKKLVESFKVNPDIPDDQKDEAWKEYIVSKCLLYPSGEGDWKYEGGIFAGTIESLYQMIMQASHFVPPEVLPNLIFELK